MHLESVIRQPGQHELMIQGIEVALSIPESPRFDVFAIVAHPHPLYQGSMMNKVVTTTAKAIFNLSIPVLRFNFRGVGKSIGQFDQGNAETEDMLCLIRTWRQHFPEAKLLLSGFSFGSFVAYRAAQIIIPHGLLLIAPPVYRFDFNPSKMQKRPDLILMGEADEVVSAQDVGQFARSFVPPIPTIWLPETGHYFHGKLLDLRELVMQWTNTCLSQD